jgi:hypothetical protein
LIAKLYIVPTNGKGVYNMAKGKGKKVSSGGPHKKHGPKRHMFRWAGAMKHEFAKSGLLSKYNDFES